MSEMASSDAADQRELLLRMGDILSDMLALLDDGRDLSHLEHVDGQINDLDLRVYRLEIRYRVAALRGELEKAK